MHFYKYQSVSALSLSMLKKGEVFFSSSEELNDEHECRPKYIFNATEQVWLRFIDFLLVRVCVKFNINPSSDIGDKLISLCGDIYKQAAPKVNERDVEYPDLLESLGEAMEGVFGQAFNEVDKDFLMNCFWAYVEEDFKAELYEQKYMASFSLNATSPAMWDSYGNDGKGFLVVYEAKNSSVCVESDICNLYGSRKRENGTYELGFYSEKRLEFKKIKYSEGSAIANGFGRLLHKFRYTEEEDFYNVPMLLDGDIEEVNTGLVKRIEREYEKEVRLFYPARKKKVDSVFRTLRIKNDQIKGVVFGSKMSSLDREKVAVACYYLRSSSEHDGDFYFYETVDLSDSCKVGIRPVGALESLYAPDSSMIKPVERLPGEEQSKMIDVAKSIEENS